MNRITSTLTVISLAVLLGAPHAAAQHCNGEVAVVPLVDRTLYIDDRGDSLWLYLESNHVNGLQSGGECAVDKPPCTTLFSADPCAHSAPDTYLYGVVVP